MPPDTRTKKKDKRRLVNSFVWTDEEAKYLKAVLKWKEKEPVASHSDDENKKEKKGDGLSHPHRGSNQEKENQQQVEQEKPAGEFRILVIGARGTGKTSILTRFATDTFPGEDSPPDPFYSRGCRHRIELDSSAYSFTLPGQGHSQALLSPRPLPQQTSNNESNNITPWTPTKPQSQTQTQSQAQTQPNQSQPAQPQQNQQKRIYIIDALELPSQHLPSNPMLEQALNLTEAGVLVYDVCDAKSLQLVVGIAEFVKEYLDKVNAVAVGNGIADGGNGIGNGYPRRREFPLILVGNKCDVSSSPPSSSSSLASLAEGGEDDKREKEKEKDVEKEDDEEESDSKDRAETEQAEGVYKKRRQVPWSEGSNAASKITALFYTNSNTNLTAPSTNIHKSGNGPAGMLSPTSALISLNPQGPVPFLEVSAKTGQNINIIFPMLAREILRGKWLFDQKIKRLHVQERERRQQRQQKQVNLGPRSRDLLVAAGHIQSQTQTQGPSYGLGTGMDMGTGMGYRGVGGTWNYDQTGNGKDSLTTGYSPSTLEGDGNGRDGLLRRKKTFWRRVMGCVCCFGG